MSCTTAPRRLPPLMLSVWVFAATFSLTACQSHGQPVLDRLVGHADSGTLAKLQFDLKDDMPVTSIAWSPDGRYIAAASTQGNHIHVWDVEHRKRVQDFERTSATPAFRELSWGPSGDLAICDGNRATVKLYNPGNWSQPRVLVSDRDLTCEATALSSDGRELAVLGNSLTIYSLPDGHLVKFLDLVQQVSHGIPFMFEAIAYVPHTHTVLIGGNAHETSALHSQVTGHIWVLEETDTLPHRDFVAYRYEPPAAPAHLVSLAISPDGSAVATGTMTGSRAQPLGTVTASVHILRIADGALLGAPLDGLPFNDPQGIQYSPDGHYLLVAHGGIYNPHVIHVLDAKTFRVLDTAHAANTIYGLTVQPDSRRFAVSAGTRIHVWSLAATH